MGVWNRAINPTRRQESFVKAGLAAVAGKLQGRVRSPLRHHHPPPTSAGTPLLPPARLLHSLGRVSGRSLNPEEEVCPSVLPTAFAGSSGTPSDITGTSHGARPAALESGPSPRGRVCRGQVSETGFSLTLSAAIVKRRLTWTHPTRRESPRHGRLPAPHPAPPARPSAHELSHETPPRVTCGQG